MDNPVDVPTVAIRVSAPIFLRPGDWVWRPVPVITDDVEEYVYTRDELARVFFAYGAIVEAIMKRTSAVHRFRLVAHGLITGRILGEYQWIWSPALGAYVPVTEPLILWPHAWEIPEVVKRGAKLHSGTSPYPRAVSWGESKGLWER